MRTQKNIELPRFQVRISRCGIHPERLNRSRAPAGVMSHIHMSSTRISPASFMDFRPGPNCCVRIPRTREIAAKRPILRCREARSEHTVAVLKGEKAMLIRIGERFDPRRFNAQELHAQVARAHRKTRPDRESGETGGLRTRPAPRPNSYSIDRDTRRISALSPAKFEMTTFKMLVPMLWVINQKVHLLRTCGYQLTCEQPIRSDLARLDHNSPCPEVSCDDRGNLTDHHSVMSWTWSERSSGSRP